MAPISFRTYVQSRRVTDTPAGDFVADAKADPTFPDPPTWQELEGYLRRRGAIRDAIMAGRAVWRGYQAARRRAASKSRAR